MAEFELPPGHPISIEQAKDLMKGPLADVYRGILAKSCAPLFWYQNDAPDFPVLNNGTVTFLRTPERLLGVTAAHVVRGYFNDARGGGVSLQMMDRGITNLEARMIDINDRLDIATFAVDGDLLGNLGKPTQPLENWPPREPQEGRAIMLAGYPGNDIINEQNRSRRLNFGLATALVIAQRVTDKQITWLVDRENETWTGEGAPPGFLALGGVSGGPLITWIETRSHIITYALGGIIIEHPDYAPDENEDQIMIERVIAIRADFIAPSGRIFHG